MEIVIHHTVELGDRAFWLAIIIIALVLAYAAYPMVTPFLFPGPSKGQFGFSK